MLEELCAEYGQNRHVLTDMLLTEFVSHGKVTIESIQFEPEMGDQLKHSMVVQLYFCIENMCTSMCIQNWQ